MLKLFNYLTRKKQIFRPRQRGRVGLYTCGPTVYHYAHIGNLRTYIFEDVLRRTLAYSGMKVKHVMNITDVGHLTSDADTGEDKIETGAKREGKSVWAIAKFFTTAFLADIKKLHILRADILTPATKHIPGQIRIIRELFKKGFAYETSQAVYFHVPKFRGYTKLSRQPLAKQLRGARDEVIVDPEKKHPADFVLWFKLVSRYKNHTMRWPSPWGPGFPGWHIECSAISSHYLGQPFDIHTGGIDHLTVHHTNEIAQSEGAYGKPLARFWVEGEHMMVDAKKMSKSLGNFYILADFEKKGYHPLDFRYFVLGAHYRKPLNFTWDALGAARQARLRVMERLERLSSPAPSALHHQEGHGLGAKLVARAKTDFQKAIEDDLNTPRALAVLNALLRSTLSVHERSNMSVHGRQLAVKTISDFDRVLGLGLKQRKVFKSPRGEARDMQRLLHQRELYRSEKRFAEADKIREQLRSAGYTIEDTPSGSRLRNRPDQ